VKGLELGLAWVVLRLVVLLPLLLDVGSVHVLAYVGGSHGLCVVLASRIGV